MLYILYNCITYAWYTAKINFLQIINFLKVFQRSQRGVIIHTLPITYQDETFDSAQRKLSKYIKVLPVSNRSEQFKDIL